MSTLVKSIVYRNLESGQMNSSFPYDVIVERPDCVCLLIEDHKPTQVTTASAACPSVLFFSESLGATVEAEFETLAGWYVFSASAVRDGVAVCLLPGESK